MSKQKTQRLIQDTVRIWVSSDYLNNIGKFQSPECYSTVFTHWPINYIQVIQFMLNTVVDLDSIVKVILSIQIKMVSHVEFYTIGHKK